MLNEKSITELRAIAQAMGAPMSFTDDKKKLIQSIEAATKEKVPAPPAPQPNLLPDLRLRSRPPSGLLKPEEVDGLLIPYADIGLRIDYPTQDQWHMFYQGKEDSGSMRMELRTLLTCAKRLMGIP